MLLVMAVLQDGFSHAGMILANIIIIFSHFFILRVTWDIHNPSQSRTISFRSDFPAHKYQLRALLTLILYQ